MTKAITKTTADNRDVFEARKREFQVKDLISARDKLQTEFDALMSDEDMTEEALQKGQELLTQIAEMNRSIGVKSSRKEHSKAE
jgi:hypothetical protein